jgi:MFS family permease
MLLNRLNAVGEAKQMKTRPAAIIGPLFLTQVAVTFESAMLYAALPTLIRDYGDPVMAGWLLTVHALVGAAAAMVAGRLGDIKGRQKVTLVLLLIAAVGSVASALTNEFAVVLIGRAMQGVAMAVLPLSIGILRESLPSERVPVAVGLMITAQSLGVAVGLVLGGIIIDTIDWHALFVASASLLALSWVAVRLWIPARPGNPPEEAIDWIEGLLPVPGILALLLGMTWSKTVGWAEPQVYFLILSGIAIMAFWTRRSLGALEPFIDLRLLGTRNIALANSIVVLLALGTLHLVFVMSSYTQSPRWTMVGLGLSATVAGLAKLPSNIFSFLAGPLSGWLTQRYGDRAPIVSGGLLAAAGWFTAASMPRSLFDVILLLCVISFGTTLLNTAVPNVIVSSVPEERTSEAVGTMAAIMGMAMAIGSQVIVLMLSTATVIARTGGAAFPSAASYRLTMAWIGSLTVLAALLGLFLKSVSQSPQKTALAR